MFSNNLRLIASINASRRLVRPSIRMMSCYDPPDYDPSWNGGSSGGGIIPGPLYIWHPLHPCNPIYDGDSKKENNPNNNGGGDFLKFIFIGLGGLILFCNIIEDDYTKKRERDRYKRY